MALALDIAWAHLAGRRRQTLVSIGGVVLGVAFFLAVSSMMRGSEREFLKRLVDASAHITVYDEPRHPPPPPAAQHWPEAAVQLQGDKPRSDARGIRNWRTQLAYLDGIDGVRAAAVLSGSALLLSAGQRQGVALVGVEPERFKQVAIVQQKMVAGSIDALAADANGAVIGQGLADKYKLRMGAVLTLSTTTAVGRGDSRSLRVVGVFRTGNAAIDDSQVYVRLARAQTMLGQEQRVNRLLVQIDDPYAARALAAALEARSGYKSVSWLEANADILGLLIVRGVIMYSVVSAILIVAAFGIYNTISTIVIEKARDIAILKSMGFRARDVRRIFLLEGLIVGAAGALLGVGLGLAMMSQLARLEIKAPGLVAPERLPLWWGVDQFLLAAGFALGAALLAAWLPARKAGRVHPVDILRGAN
jgi:lipoprotein-releasing system permease protein